MDTVIPCGAQAPDFTLNDLHGRPHSPKQARGRILVLVFWSAECPWAERADQAIRSWQAEWGEDVLVWWIAANASEPLELLQKAAAARRLPVVLYDRQAAVADLYGAQVTPHVFVVDAAGILRYQGGVDDITFRQRVPSRYYLNEAVQALLAGRTPEPSVTPAFGCTIVRLSGGQTEEQAGA